MRPLLSLQGGLPVLGFQDGVVTRWAVRCLARDPLAGLQMTSSNYHRLGQRLTAVSQELCGETPRYSQASLPVSSLGYQPLSVAPQALQQMTSSTYHRLGQRLPSPRSSAVSVRGSHCLQVNCPLASWLRQSCLRVRKARACPAHGWEGCAVQGASIWQH